MTKARDLANVRYTEGTTAARPTGNQGDLYYDTTIDNLFQKNSSAWVVAGTSSLISVDYLVLAGGGGSGAGGGTSGGGGAGGAYVGSGLAGGSGVVILKFPTASGTITIGAGLTGSTTTSGSDTIATITAGTGNVSWA